MKWVKFGRPWSQGKVKAVVLPSIRGFDYYVFMRTGEELPRLKASTQASLHREWSLLPDVVDFFARREKAAAAFRKDQANSFVGQGLNRPGTLLVADGEVLLLGHADSLGHATEPGGLVKLRDTDKIKPHTIIEYYAHLELPDPPGP